MLSILSLVAPLASATTPTRVWLDVDIQHLAAEETTALDMPYAWLDDGVLSAELLGDIERVSVDLEHLVEELDGQPPGTRRELEIVTADERMVVAVERRSHPGGRRARRLWLETAPTERTEIPLGLARLALTFAGDLSQLGELGDMVEVDRVLKEMAHDVPFTLLTWTGPDGAVRVGTE